MHTFSRFARPYQRSRVAFSTVPVGNQIAESALTLSLGVEYQRRSEHPDLFGSQSVRLGRLSLVGPGNRLPLLGSTAVPFESCNDIATGCSESVRVLVPLGEDVVEPLP
jgi:hypothetical protein